MERKGKKGNILKVVELGIENKVYDELKKPDFSIENFTKRLNEEGIKITSQSIRKFIKKTKKAQQQIIKSDLQVAEQVKELTLNYTNELRDILNEVQEVKNTARDEKDLTTYNQLIGRIYQGIELLAKLSGDLAPQGKIDINILYQEISSDMEKNMRSIKNEMFNKEFDIEAEIVEEDGIHERRLKNDL